MIIQAQFKLPQPIYVGLRWLFFCAYYEPKRKPNENGSRYYRKRKKAFEAWLASDKFHPSSTVEDKPRVDSPA